MLFCFKWSGNKYIMIRVWFQHSDACNLPHSLAAEICLVASGLVPLLTLKALVRIHRLPLYCYT